MAANVNSNSFNTYNSPGSGSTVSSVSVSSASSNTPYLADLGANCNYMGLQSQMSSMYNPQQHWYTDQMLMPSGSSIESFLEPARQQNLYAMQNHQQPHQQHPSSDMMSQVGDMNQQNDNVAPTPSQTRSGKKRKHLGVDKKVYQV